MRSRGLSAELAQLKEQLGEIARPLVELNAEKIDDEILFHVLEQLDRFHSRGHCHRRRSGQ
jgi:hypothetical protein